VDNTRTTAGAIGRRGRRAAARAPTVAAGRAGPGAKPSALPVPPAAEARPVPSPSVPVMPVMPVAFPIAAPGMIAGAIGPPWQGSSAWILGMGRWASRSGPRTTRWMWMTRRRDGGSGSGTMRWGDRGSGSGMMRRRNDGSVPGVRRGRRMGQSDRVSRQPGCGVRRTAAAMHVSGTGRARGPRLGRQHTPSSAEGECRHANVFHPRAHGRFSSR
jgi:hypothetical protein